MKQALLNIGEEIASYRIESFVARGGMAVVYRAMDIRLARTVALKLLAPELSANDNFRQRFMRESRLAAACDHPNIIPIYEAGEVEDRLYIAMRYVVGSDLRGLLDREGPLPLDRALALFSQVAGALDAAHARGLVHRDVKPGNIMVASGAGHEDSDHVYLTDFGLTKRSLSLTGYTTAGHFLGTIDYVAPEQIAGKPVDARADIYALGSVLYEALTAVPPFQRDDDAALLWAHLSAPPPRVTVHRPDLPPQVDHVLARALAKEPEDRYSSCREFLSELRQLHGAPSAESGGERGSHPPEAGRERGSHSPEAGGERGSRLPEVGSGRVTAPGQRQPAPADSVPTPVGGPPTSPPSAPASPHAADNGAGTTSRGLPVRLLSAAVGLVVLLAVAAVFALHGGSDRDGRLSETYHGSLAVPFTFRYPHGWSGVPHGGNTGFVVFSRRPHDEQQLFAGGGWRETDQLLRDRPGDVAGLWTRHTANGLYDITNPAAIQEQIRSDMSGSSFTFERPQRLSLGDHDTLRVEGTMKEPNGSGTLRFRYFLVAVQPFGDETAHLLFFSTPDRFAKDGTTFDAISASADFSQAAG